MVTNALNTGTFDISIPSALRIPEAKTFTMADTLNAKAQGMPVLITHAAVTPTELPTISVMLNMFMNCSTEGNKKSMKFAAARKNIIL